MKSDWKQFKISDFLLRKKDQIFIDDKKIYKRLTIKMHNKGICVRDEIVGSRIGTKNQFTIKSGWLLLSKIDARNGAFGIIPSEADGGIITGNFWAYELDLSKIDPQFFFYFSHSQKFLDFCIASSQGATNRRYLQEELFLNREILLPPLPEQKRIVKKIKEVEEKVNKTKKIKEDEYKYLDFLIEEVFLKITSKNWDKKKLGDPEIAKMSSGGTPSRGNSKYYNGDIVWLKSGELKDNLNIVNSEEKITEIALENSSAKIFDIGTVLLAMYGATVGKVGILGVPAATNQAVAAIKPNEKKLFNKYLFYFLKSLRKDLVGIGFGGAQPNISQTVVKKILIPLPNIDEQKKLIASFEAFLVIVDLLNKEIKKSDEYLKSLMPSVLAKAFNGEL